MKGEKNKEFEVELTDEQLENANGGFGYHNESSIFRYDKFIFDEDDIATLAENGITGLKANHQYNTKDLYKKLGTKKKGDKVRNKLVDMLGYFTPY